MNQVPIEINGNVHFSKIWDSEFFKSLHIVTEVNKKAFQ